MTEFHVPLATREELVAEARYTISRGDYDLHNSTIGSLGDRAARAKAQYARASVLIQLAGYLGAAEEGEDRIERQRQDDYIAGHALAADTGGTSQRRGVHGDPWRAGTRRTADYEESTQ